MLQLASMWTSLHRTGSALLIALVAVQAIIAGQHIFGTWGIEIHAALGNATFGIAVLVTAIAFLKFDGNTLGVIGIVIIVLVSAQIGLGYSARNSEGAAALHIPLGVGVFGAVLYQLLAAWPSLIGLRTRAPISGTDAS